MSTAQNKDQPKSKAPKPAPEDLDEELDEELEDSFPASDPPASTAPGHKEPNLDNPPMKAALPDAAS